MSSEDDTAYKQLFAHPEMVRDLLLGFVPGEWGSQLDLNSFERVNGSYISDAGGHRHGDMVWRVRLAGGWIYLLLEFQSRPDPWMALRMQVYTGLLYQDLIKRGELPQPGRLPPVLPIVLYVGKRPWHAKLNLSELVLPASENLQSLQASQSYQLLDLHRMRSRQLHKNVIAIVFEMERSGSWEDLKLAEQRLKNVARGKQRFELAQSVGLWSTLRLQRLAKRLNIKFVADAKEVAMPRPELKTFLDGLNYGMVLGSQRNRLYFLLRQRFGKVPKRYENQIDNAEMDDLDIWYGRLFDASSVREIFEETQPT